MSAMDQYEFADLNAKEKLLEKITSLESEIAREMGEPITLIAYTPRDEDGQTESCRVGVNE